MARVQSSSPRTPSSSSTARRRRRHTPAWVHSCNRRCAVGTLTPNDGGICRQEQPLVSTNTITVNTARSPALRRPPPCRRTPCSGSSGAAMAHNSSGTNRRDRSSTDDHHESTAIRLRILSAPERRGQVMTMPLVRHIRRLMKTMPRRPPERWTTTSSSCLLPETEYPQSRMQLTGRCRAYPEKAQPPRQPTPRRTKSRPRLRRSGTRSTRNPELHVQPIMLTFLLSLLTDPIRGDEHPHRKLDNECTAPAIGWFCSMYSPPGTVDRGSALHSLWR